MHSCCTMHKISQQSITYNLDETRMKLLSNLNFDGKNFHEIGPKTDFEFMKHRGHISPSLVSSKVSVSVTQSILIEYIQFSGSSLLSTFPLWLGTIKLAWLNPYWVWQETRLTGPVSEHQRHPRTTQINSATPGQNSHHFGRQHFQMHFLGWKW